jgi:glycine/D-amino acid oxidase-like deaminating enzyme
VITSSPVAILGGGIMGCCLALDLARRGTNSVIFEMEEQLLSGASRWNEGKIHLGYLYSGDPSLATAKKVLPGGLAFKPLIEELIGGSIDSAVTQADDIFLCHERSVVSPREMAAYFHALSELVREHPARSDYLRDLQSAGVVPLSRDELETITQSRSILAGFRIPERSVSTTWIADRLVDAVRANDRIEIRTGRRVTSVVDASTLATKDRWRITTAGGAEDVFDCVVNALWHGRLAVDATVPLPLPREWSHRYRMALFLRTHHHFSLPSVLIATGPFGDVKNYNGRDFYLSWYTRGLRSESMAVVPEQPLPWDAHEQHEFAQSVVHHLGELVPGVRNVFHNAESVRVNGGWVFAARTGSLSDPHATIHGRTDFGVVRKGSYVSIDTGKYSTAPWLARELCIELLGHE